MSAEQTRAILADAQHIAALTGAGISAESGIPTFRSNTSSTEPRATASGPVPLWDRFRPEDLATPEAFARDPQLVWQWYDWRRSLIAQAQPNPGHLALAELARRLPRFTLITQNVDGLHDRAGSHALKLHGDIWDLRCTICGHERHDPAPSLDPLPPYCNCGGSGESRCRGMMRPGVVWFGEPLPAHIWQQAEEAASSCDVFLVIGTSALVYPAAGLVHIAKNHGARIIEINPADTPLSGIVDVAWRSPAASALPQLLQP